MSERNVRRKFLRYAKKICETPYLGLFENTNDDMLNNVVTAAGSGDMSTFESDSSVLSSKRNRFTENLFTIDPTENSMKKSKEIVKSEHSKISLSSGKISKGVEILPTEFTFPLKDATNQVSSTPYAEGRRIPTVEKNIPGCSSLSNIKEQMQLKLHSSKNVSTQNLSTIYKEINNREILHPLQKESLLDSSGITNGTLDNILLNEKILENMLQEVLDTVNTNKNLLEKVLMEVQFLKSEISKLRTEVKAFLGNKEKIVLDSEIMSHLATCEK